MVFDKEHALMMIMSVLLDYKSINATIHVHAHGQRTKAAYKFNWHASYM